MLARLFVLLPFSVTVPEGEKFTVYGYPDSGYIVHVFPPSKSDKPELDEIGEIRLDGILAFQANALRIDFHKESFNRAKDSECDPPEDVIRRALNSFLIRLRYVTKAFQVRLLDYPQVTWRLQYLNDDETELAGDEKLIRARAALRFSLSWIALNKQIWQSIHELPPNYEPPPWEDLLLDAKSCLPVGGPAHIGPAIVLAATALEAFISRILDDLAALRPVPTELWTWINQRHDYRCEPAVEEQYDVLLKFFTGHSLKTEAKLWQSFMNLKAARNKFVHEGVAKVGGIPVSLEVAGTLVDAASETILKVREWIPQELHWPVFKHVVQVEASTKRLM